MGVGFTVRGTIFPLSEHDNRAETDNMDRMYEWLGVVCDELGIDKELLHAVVPQLLDLTRDVAHGPSRPAAPMTAFLLGVAANRTTATDDRAVDGTADTTAELSRRVLDGATRLQEMIAEKH